MAGTRVSIIIVNYNGLAYLKNCLKSLKNQTYPDYDIIICDNASHDGSIEYITQHYPEITLIRNSRNLGFAEGNNIAFELALKHGSEYIFLLNNDTLVDPFALDNLVQTAVSDVRIGIVGPTVLDIKDRRTVQEAGMSIDRFGFPMPSSNGFQQKVFFVSGCAMLIKRKVLQSIGFFDSEYFMFAEDLDLCWRAQLAGYVVSVNKSSIIYHESGGSMVGGVAKPTHYKTDIRRIYFREKNTLRTLLKNYGTTNMLTTIPFYVTLQLLESTVWLFLRKPGTAYNILRAILRNLTMFRETMRLRAKVQSLREISDKDIVNRMTKGYLKLSMIRTLGLPDVVESKSRIS